jgi:hypothetical protein
MARLSAQERKMLADLSKRAQDEDEKDSGLELWVKTQAGHEVKLTGTKASAYARKHGLDLDEDDDQEDEDGGEEELEPKEKKSGGGYFKGKSTGGH